MGPQMDLPKSLRDVISLLLSALLGFSTLDHLPEAPSNLPAIVDRCWLTGCSLDDVVPAMRNFPLGESTGMVGTRSVLSFVFPVCRSWRGLRLPSSSTDIDRRWSGPNECSTNNMPFEGRSARDLAVPLFPSTAFPVGFMSNNVSRPSLSTLKLETELSPPLVVRRNRQSGLRMTLAPPQRHTEGDHFRGGYPDV
jgi:hypothetical protein